MKFVRRTLLLSQGLTKKSSVTTGLVKKSPKRPQPHLRSLIITITQRVLPRQTPISFTVAGGDQPSPD